LYGTKGREKGAEGIDILMHSDPRDIDEFGDTLLEGALADDLERVLREQQEGGA